VGWSLLCNEVVVFEDTGAASRRPERPAAPAGPPEGDRPSAPAATARDSLRRRSGYLNMRQLRCRPSRHTCARGPCGEEFEGLQAAVRGGAH